MKGVAVMTRHYLTLIMTALLLGASFWTPTQAEAQSMADYTSTPAFAVDTSVPPNVLLVLDNSGSMNNMAYGYGGNVNTFDTNIVYFGLFDPYECYDYNGKFEPDPSANPLTPGTCLTDPYRWSGNLLNFGTMRRIDVVKWVMVGGKCNAGSRSAGNCSRLLGQNTFDNGACCHDQTQGVARANTIGRIPPAYETGVGVNLYFHLKASSNSLKGEFCLDDDSTLPSGNSCNEGGGYAETNWNIIIDSLTGTSGVIQEVAGKARFGLMEFSGNSQGGTVVADIGGNSTSMVNGIESATPETWTPLAESMYEASRYIAQIPPEYANSNYSDNVQNKDPYYFTSPDWASTAQYVACCDTFVILFTDGESTEDQNIPAALQDFAHGKNVHGTHCTGAGCAGHRTDYPNNGSHYLDDVAYWAHTTDLRQGTIPVINEAGKDVAGSQNVNLYTFFAFGSGSELLQSAAKAGGFQDKNGNNQPDLVEEWDEVNNLTGAAIPDGVPDTYFESSDAFQLRARLLAAITSILQRSTAGSSVSVLASSSTGEGALYQSYFFPQTFEGGREITWTGYTAGIFLDKFGNLREDTNGDRRLVYNEDNIIVSRFDAGSNTVFVDRYADANQDGVADTVTPIGTNDMKSIKGIWEAGNSLALMPSANRNLITWVDQNDNQTVDGGEQIAFTTGNASSLDAYLNPGLAPFTTNNLINFTRGDHITGLRDRRLTVGGSLNVWKLGDSIYAQPIVVGAPTQRFDVIYGDSSYTAYFAKYKNRRQVAYVGANDGMLHAFNAGFFKRGDDPVTTGTVEHGYFNLTGDNAETSHALGKELWGFIPQELLPHLKWLADPNYTHVYYVDLTPKVTDVRIFTPDADHPNGWGTVLMGGFRFGGSCGNCPAGNAPPMTLTGDFDDDGGTADTNRSFYSAYFVLDITNPEVDPKLLWSFSSSDLGLTTTVPSMLRVHPKSNAIISDNAEAKWYMLVGSGTTGYDGSIVQAGNTYAIDLAQGPGVGNANVITMASELEDAFMGNTLTIDKNFDYRVDVAYMGSTIHDGSLPWRGKLYRLTTDCPTNPCTTGTWGIDVGSGNRAPTEILDTFPTSNTIELGPISVTPGVALDDANKMWVFAGTGRYYDNVDKTNTDVQHFVGVKDSVMNSQCTESANNRTGCHDKDLVNMSNATVCLLGTGTCGQGGNEQVQNVASGVDTFQSLIAHVASKDGWYTTLPNLGERALSRPLVFGGIIFFPTYDPSSHTDLCLVTGDSRLYALNYKTGSANDTPVVGTNGTTTKQVNRVATLGQGLATEAVVHIGKGGGQGKAGIFTQNSLGQVFGTDVITAGAITSRFLSWYDVRS